MFKCLWKSLFNVIHVYIKCVSYYAKYIIFFTSYLFMYIRKLFFEKVSKCLGHSLEVSKIWKVSKWPIVSRCPEHSLEVSKINSLEVTNRHEVVESRDGRVSNFPDTCQTYRLLCSELCNIGRNSSVGSGSVHRARGP